MPKRILFISYDGMTDPLGQSQVIPYLLGLAKAGYEFYLLSCEKEQVFEKNRAIVESLLLGSGIHWVPIKYTKRPPVVSTLVDLVKIRNAAVAIHKKVGLSMVHTRPGIPSLVGLWLKNKYGIKFLNDIREFYADSRVEGGMWNTNHLISRSIYNYFKRQEARQLKGSDGIVCLTHAAEKIITTWPEYDNSIPLEVIPCSVDLNLFDASTIQQEDMVNTQKKLSIVPGDIVISYLGSIGGWYMTDEMLRFCKCLSHKIPRAKFLFISPHQHEQISHFAASHDIPAEKILMVSAARREVPVFLALSNYSIFFIKPCYSKLSSSPTKHGELMAMGIPVITNAGVGDVKVIVESYDSGIVLDGFSDGEFNKAIDSLIAKDFDRERIRQGAVEIYSLDRAVEKYKNVYAAILR